MTQQELEQIPLHLLGCRSQFWSSGWIIHSSLILVTWEKKKKKLLNRKYYTLTLLAKPMKNAQLPTFISIVRIWGEWQKWIESLWNFCLVKKLTPDQQLFILMQKFIVKQKMGLLKSNSENGCSYCCCWWCNILLKVKYFNL